MSLYNILNYLLGPSEVHYKDSNKISRIKPTHFGVVVRMVAAEKVSFHKPIVGSFQQPGQQKAEHLFKNPGAHEFGIPVDRLQYGTFPSFHKTWT